MADKRPGLLSGDEPAAAVPARASRARRWSRRLLWLGVCLAALLAVGHTPLVRGWVLERVVSSLASRHGLTIEASGLDYNLFALTVSLDEGHVGPTQESSGSIIRLTGLRAAFGTGVFGGQLDLRSLEADELAVTILASGDSGPSRAFAMPVFSAGRVRLGKISVDYVDPDAPLHLAIRGGSLQLDGYDPGRLEGPFTVDSLTFDSKTTQITSVKVVGGVVINGDEIILKPTSAIAGDDTITFDGAVAVTGSDTGYRLGADGTLSLARLHDWFPAMPAGQGVIRAKARLTGRLADPRTELSIDTPGLTWQGFALPATTVTGVVSADGIEVSRWSTAARASRLTASGHLAFGSPELSTVRLEWSGVTPGFLTAAFRQTWSVAPPLSAGGSATLTWHGFLPSLASLSGTADANIAAHGNRHERGAVHVSASDGRWRMRAEQSLAGTTRATFDGNLVVANDLFASSNLSGSFSLSAGDAREAVAYLAELGIPVPPLPAALEAFPLTIDAELSGPVRNPRLAGRLSSSALRIAGVGTMKAEADFATTFDALTIEGLRAEDGHGTTVEAEGRVAFRDGATGGSLSVRAASLDPLAPFLPEGWKAAGVVDVEGTWGGTVGDPTAELRVTGRDVAINQSEPGPLDATLTLSGGLVRLEGTVPALAARVQGTLGVAELFPYQMAVSLEGADIARLSRLAPEAWRPVDMTGTISAEVSVTHAFHSTEGPSTHVRLDRLDARVNDHPVVLTAPATIELGPAKVVVDRLSLQSGGATLVVHGRIDRTDSGSLAATLDAPAEDLLQWITGTDRWADVAAEGRVHVEARAAGPAGAVALGGRAHIALDRLEMGEHTIAEGIQADIALRSDVIEATRVTGTVLGGPVDLSASIPTAWLADYLPGPLAPADARAGTARLRGRITTDARTALDLVWKERPAQMSGSVTVSLDATSSRPAVEAVDATATIESDQIVLGDVPFSLSIPAELTLGAGRVQVRNVELRSRAATFSLEGYADLVGAVETDLRLTAKGPLAFLSSVLPGRVSGEFAAHVGLSGPSGARTAAGTILLEGAELVMPAYRLALTDWSGQVDLTPQALTARNLQGQVNGGVAALRGRLPLDAASPDASTLRLSVRDAFVEIVKGFKSQVDADLGLQQYDTFLHIDGAVTVVTGAYREPITAMAALFPRAGVGAGADADRRSPLGGVTLDVRLLAQSPIIVENSLGRVDLVPDMRLVGTLADPALAGSLNALEGGRLTLAGRRYRILESQIGFSPRDGLQPRVDLSSETQVGEYTINLRVQGPVNALETIATSTPPLSDRDLRSLIVTGRVADESGGDDDAFAMEALSSEILGFAGQMVGLDSVQFGRADFDIGVSDVNPATRLTVMKSLNRWFRIILSENLDDNRLTWIIVVDSGRGYEFRFSERDNREEVIEFRHDLEFGPGSSARRAAVGQASGLVRPVVSSVVFSGTPGANARDLQDVVKTRVGKPFDVEQWQRDRERLEGFFRERGHATARITPRRTTTETRTGERVEVEYRVDAGPRTILEVEGMSLPDGVVRDLYQAWSASVLLEFFGDEIVRIVGEHLSGKNFLWPTVDVTFDQPSDTTQHAMVRIVAGPRADSKQIVFEGHRAVPEREIRTKADTGKALEHAWIDSRPLQDAVATVYREHGYFGASAKALPLEADGGRATLRVHIEEGPRARIDKLEIDGVPPQRLSPVSAAADLQPGSVFLPASDREASARVRRWYEDQGFLSVDIRSTRIINDDGTVAIRLAVSEGPQSVVTSVRVEGLESTRPGPVAGAVTLGPGDLASATTASDTQKRLYGLGVFRSAEVLFEPGAPDPALKDGQVPVEAVVTLSEAKRYQLRYGVQLSSAHGPLLEDIRSAFGVAADVRDRNFLGRGITLGASGRYERDLQSARGLLFLPRTLRQRLESNVYATWRNERSVQDELTFVDSRQDLTFEQRLHVRRGVELAWGYSYYWRNFEISVAPFNETLDIGGTLAAAQASIVVDRRDNVFDATRGWFHSQNVQIGAQALGSDTSYTRYLLRQYVYVPVGPLVFASGLRWGTLARVNGTPPLTIFDLFFDAGGSQTVRGYAQDSLSSLSLLGVPVGGTDLLILNQEIRFPIFKWFKGAAFIDAGNTFGALSDISLSGLAVGAGIGLRIQTPLAPFRLDLGFPIGPFREGRYRWHFSVGQMF